MPPKTDEPRFSEEEFALILRRAIELDAGSAAVPHTPPPKMPPGGLTLSEIRGIAVEVGIDPGRVLEAVDSLATPEWGTLARLFGGPPKMLVERSIGCRPGPEEMSCILDLVRRLTETQGESHEVLGGVEWKNDSKVAPLVVRVSPEGDGAKVTASVERGKEAFLSHYIPIMVSLGIAGITVGIVEPAAGLAIAGTVAGGAAVGYGLARTIWTRGTRRWQSLLDRLTSGAVAESRAALEPPRTPIDSPGPEGEPFPS